MKSLRMIFLVLTTVRLAFAAAEDPLAGAARILFLGDSITQRGTYIVNFEAWLVQRYPNRRFEVINAGLGSETVSGLSEPNHANGRFPRPVLFERLERVLAKTTPDLIIACYGMNCGIRLPLNEERFARYRHGILRLRAAAAQYGAEIIHVTPPIFDNHGHDGFDYDAVLTAYAAWLVEQRQQGWRVIDVHSEMRAKVDARKQVDPAFTVQKDRVHPNKEGHWMMAQSLIAYCGGADAAVELSAAGLATEKQLKALTQRMQGLLRAIHAETKPLRPGAPQGGTLASARAQAQGLASVIYGAAEH